MSLPEGDDDGDMEISIKDELPVTEEDSLDQEEDTTSSEPRPRNITDENIESVLEELDTASPLVKEYIKIARNCEASRDLEFRLSYNHSGVFLRVTNIHPDLYLLYRNNISLVVRSLGSDLLCTLYNYKHQILKGIVLKDFGNYLEDVSTRLGITMFLKELDRDRYRVCSGAFAEGELIGDLNKENLKTLLIEKFEGSIIYRSRDCFTLVPGQPEESGGCGTSSCQCCLKLKMDLATSLREKGFQGYPDPPDNLDLSSDNPLASFVEVCMDSETEDSLHGEGLDDKENQEDGEDNFPTSLSQSPRSLRSPQRKVKSTKISYKKLIISALLSSPNQRLRLGEIYDWILDRYPLFNENKMAFQNSIRHNLSLNKIFVKLHSEKTMHTKGGFWTLDPSELKKLTHFTLPDNIKFNSTQDGFKIKLPPLPKKQSGVPTSEKKDLTITSRSRFIAIAPKPGQGENKSEEQENDPGCLVIDENSEPAVNSLPANIKEQLKTGVPIILRPLDNPSSKPIIIQPNGDVSIAPVGIDGKANGGLSLSTTRSASVLSSPLLTSSSPGAKSKTRSVASVPSNEFPKPPFTYKELCMICIFYQSSKESTLMSMYDHIKLWFPYYRQKTIGIHWMSSIQKALNFTAFSRIGMSKEKGGRWTFDQEETTWRKLVASNKWFETPLDADLFNYMSTHVPEFKEKVFTKRNLFKSVPITVKADAKLAVLAAEANNQAKRIKLEQVESIKEPTDDLQADEEDEDEVEDDAEAVGENDTIDVKMERLEDPEDQTPDNLPDEMDTGDDPLA